MAVLVVGSEKNFTELRSRLFTGRVPAAALQRANAALAAANPHVDLAALQPGTVLTVPDVPEIPDRGALSLDPSVSGGVDAIAKQLQSDLAAMLDEAEAVIRRERVEHKQTIAAFDDDLVRRAADANKDLAAALAAARDAIKSAEAETGARRDGVKQAIDAWNGELETLRKLAG